MYTLLYNDNKNFMFVQHREHTKRISNKTILIFALSAVITSNYK